MGALILIIIDVWVLQIRPWQNLHLNQSNRIIKDRQQKKNRKAGGQITINKGLHLTNAGGSVQKGMKPKRRKLISSQF